MTRRPPSPFAILIALSTVIAAAQDLRQPEEVQMGIAKGQDAVNSQRYGEAEKAFKQAIKVSHNTCRQCYVELISLYWRMGDGEGALKSADNALKLSQKESEKAEIL